VKAGGFSTGTPADGIEQLVRRSRNVIPGSIG
jgi:hypothetical protein